MFRPLNQVDCWNCGDKGHYSTSCTKPKKDGFRPAPPNVRGNATMVPKPRANVNARRAWVNHVTEEEA